MTFGSQTATKRIAVIVPKYGLAGGAEQFAARLTETLARETPHEFHVFANRWRETPGSPVRFHRLPNLPWPRCLRPWLFAKAVERAVGKSRFDLVHAHDRVFGADIVSLHGVPHSMWVRDVRKKKSGLFDLAMSRVERRMLESGDRTVFLPVSRLAMEKYQNEYPGLRGTWKVMHPGVDPERFASPDRMECRKEISAKHGVPESGFLLLFVGMNFDLKGLATAITALALARERNPKTGISLLVVGKGDEAKYRALAESQNVGGSVFFAGAQTEAIERYYRSANALIFLSEFETFGMVVLEAMASGLPVLIGPNVGARDIVEDSETGYILRDARDPKEAAAGITQFIHENLFLSMGLKASNAAARHSWSNCAAEMGEVYESKFRGS